MPDNPYSDPFEWFDAWFSHALQTDIPNPNAMTIATADPDGTLSVRVVLLKSWDHEGFVFYTNLRSHKGRALAGNKHIGVNFYWRTLDRQIRIEGEVAQVSDDQADEYFATRPRESQIGAWASEQSQPLESRQVLIDRVAEFTKKYDGEEVPRPPHWSGFRIVPSSMEFWENGEFRLHDRWRFDRSEDGWVAQRLSP